MMKHEDFYPILKAKAPSPHKLSELGKKTAKKSLRSKSKLLQTCCMLSTPLLDLQADTGAEWGCPPDTSSLSAP